MTSKTATIVVMVACAVAAAVLIVAFRMVGGRPATSAARTAPSVSPSSRDSSSALPPSASRSAASSAPPASSPARPRLQIGAVTNNLSQFEETDQVYPQINVKYVQWGSAFPSAQIAGNHALSATTMVVLEPSGVSLAAIARGDDDSFLRSWAQSEQELGLPVIISFAPEANGSWYQWGAGHVSPATYRAAWQHVHGVLAGDKNITWLWQVNVTWQGSESLASLWPGAQYVNEVGIDGQLSNGSASFASVFAPTVAQVRAITKRPVMISEVSVAKGKNRPAQLTGLIASARRAALTALILFDVHPRWQVDDDPAALAALRAAAQAAVRK